MTITSGEELTRENEGLTLVAKPDAKGFWEIGYGHDIPPSPGLVWTEDQADAQFASDYAVASAQAARDVGTLTWATLSLERQAVLTDMAYEVGGAGLHQFVTFLNYVRQGNWPDAAADLRTTKLFAQVPEREERNIQILLTGDWPSS